MKLFLIHGEIGLPDLDFFKIVRTKTNYWARYNVVAILTSGCRWVYLKLIMHLKFTYQWLAWHSWNIDAIVIAKSCWYFNMNYMDLMFYITCGVQLQVENLQPSFQGSARYRNTWEGLLLLVIIKDGDNCLQV